MEQLIDISFGIFRATAKVTKDSPDGITGFLTSSQPYINLITVVTAVVAIVLTVTSRRWDRTAQVKEHLRRYYVLLVIDPVFQLVNSFTRRFDYLVAAHSRALSNVDNTLSDAELKELHDKFDGDFAELETIIVQCHTAWGSSQLESDLESTLDAFEDQLTGHIAQLSAPDRRTSANDVRRVVRTLTVDFARIVRKHDPVSEPELTIHDHLRSWRASVSKNRKAL